MTFFEQITLIKTEIERSIINVLKLGKELKALTPYLEKASREELKEAFKMLNLVKDKILTSGNDGGKKIKDVERKFIQAELMNWGNMPETKGMISEASERILKVFDDNSKVLNMVALELNSLPESIGQLSTLQHFCLSHNCVESLPETFGQLSQLQWLVLSDNNL